MGACQLAWGPGLMQASADMVPRALLTWPPSASAPGKLGVQHMLILGVREQREPPQGWFIFLCPTSPPCQLAHPEHPSQLSPGAHHVLTVPAYLQR